MHGPDGSFGDPQLLSLRALLGGVQVDLDDLVDILKLALVGLVDEPELLALVLDVVEADPAVGSRGIEGVEENLEVGVLPEHLLHVVVDEVEQAVHPPMVLCLPHPLDQPHALPVVLGLHHAVPHHQQRVEVLESLPHHLLRPHAGLLVDEPGEEVDT